MFTRFTMSSQSIVVLAASLACAAVARGQATPVTFEVRPFVGAYIPTGDQRDLLKDAVLTGGQVSWHVIPAVNITGGLGWSPSKDRVTAGNQTLDLVQYDIGAELRHVSESQPAAWDFTPFVGLGVGGRTYSYRDLDVDSKTVVDGYGALGVDFGLGAFGIRIEARDYVSRSKPPAGVGDSRTRNDLGIVAGVSYRFR